MSIDKEDISRGSGNGVVSLLADALGRDWPRTEDYLKMLLASKQIVEAGISLTPSERRHLLEDIGRISILIAGATPMGESHGLPISPYESTMASSPMERLRLLCSMEAQIAAALASLHRHPARGIQEHEACRLLANCKGDSKAVRAIGASPGASLAIGAWHTAPSPIASITVDRQKVRFVQCRTTTDVPANRMVAALLDSIAREAATLASLAAYCGDHPQAADARRMADMAAHWRRAAFLRDIPPGLLCPSPGISLEEIALRSGPPYRALVGVSRRLHSGLEFDWSNSPFLVADTLDPWHLYEIWCFLQTADTLLSLGWRPVAGDVVQVRAAGLRLMLAHGRASRLRFLRPSHGDISGSEAGTLRVGGTEEVLDLFYQPLFSSANQREAMRAETAVVAPRFVSSSHAMQPDIVFRRQDRLFVLDAKYRSYESDGDEQTDIDKMHTYRDAIVTESAAKSTPAVAAAWCLFPGAGPNHGEIPMHERVRAYPAATSDRPFGSGIVGAVRLRPGATRTDFAGLLGRLTSVP